MLPSETASPAGEAEYGTRLLYITIAWIVGTVIVGILFALSQPYLVGVY